MRAQALRVLIDPGTTGAGAAAKNGPQAYGVHFMRHGRRHTVRVRREVVLAAGAIGSPQLLMVSGVGPKEHLQVRYFAYTLIQNQ